MEKGIIVRIVARHNYSPGFSMYYQSHATQKQDLETFNYVAKKCFYG